MSTNVIRKIIQKTGIDIHKYRQEVDRLYWLRSKNIESVFDIGANEGQFAAEIREILSHAQIYSFEPLKNCFEILINNFNDDTKFKGFNVALGDKNEQTIINKSSYTPSSSLLKMAKSHKQLFPHTKDSHLETINVKTLDSIFDQINPTKEILIKIDTQGYEDKVIAGGAKAFKAAKIVLIETSFVELYEKQPLFDNIYQSMKSLGFVYRGALHQKINKLTGEVIFEDSIFVRQ